MYVCVCVTAAVAGVCLTGHMLTMPLWLPGVAGSKGAFGVDYTYECKKNAETTYVSCKCTLPQSNDWEMCQVWYGAEERMLCGPLAHAWPSKTQVGYGRRLARHCFVCKYVHRSATHSGHIHTPGTAHGHASSSGAAVLCTPCLTTPTHRCKRISKRHPASSTHRRKQVSKRCPNYMPERQLRLQRHLRLTTCRNDCTCSCAVGAYRATAAWIGPGR